MHEKLKLNIPDTYCIVLIQNDKTLSAYNGKKPEPSVYSLVPSSGSTHTTSFEKK